jgi:hypothetical protein
MKVQLIIFFILWGNFLFSQTKDVTQLQPKIVVTPRVDKGQDIRALLESDFNLRNAISVVKQAFDERQYTTTDFMEALKSAEESAARSTSNQTELSKNEILNRFTKAEIEIQIDFKESNNSDGKQVNVILNANLIGEASAIATIDCQSPRLKEDVINLTKIAIKKNIDAFMSTLQMKFTEIVNNGISYQMDFQIRNGETFSFQDDIPSDDEQLSYLIYDWLRNNACKNYATMDDESETALVFTVKIPLRDTKTGMNYTISDFQRSLRKFIKEKGFSCDFAKTEGKKLYIEVFQK